VLHPVWHWLYFLPLARQSEIGPDGHPKRGGFLPPVALPRRMWAGSKLQFEGPLHVGDAVERVSTIEDVSEKSGRTGTLVFVKVRHEVRRQGEARAAILENQDIVYREPAKPGDPAPAPTAAPASSAWSRTITPDPVLLFRYSALTFNSHRIHYDRPYATGEEGYGGLVVHGPLIATLLLDLVRRSLPGAQVLRFDFRAVRPLIDTHPFQVCGEPAAESNADGTRSIRLWARDHEGWMTMDASATIG
jgi:3-methylfumaryl-CoA hydratase